MVSTCAYRHGFRNVGRNFASTTRFIQVNVGGTPFSIAVSDIKKFPGSFFQQIIKRKQTKKFAEPISIERDGALFKFVNAYLVNGHLPRNEEGLIGLDDATLNSLKEEADFYGLEKLSEECKTQRRKSYGFDLNSYLTIRKYVTSLCRKGDNLQIDLSSRLACALKCMWAPFSVSGKVGSYYYSYRSFDKMKLYGKSTIHSLNLDELIAVATQSPFGRGTETVVDTSVRNSFEIDASLLDAAALEAISKQIDSAVDTEDKPQRVGDEDDKRDEEKNEESNGEDDFKDTEDQEDLKKEAESEDTTSFWANQPKGYDSPQAIPDRMREASDADIARVFQALDQDLKSFDTIIICLQHLYPECQTNPAFLKGGDRALYDILTRSSNDYEVQVVAATIYRVHDYEHSYADNRTQFALFSPTIMKRSMDHITESDKRNKKSKKENDAAALGRTKLVIPNNLDPDSLLDYTPFVEHTGNESQGEESVYIVAGLQVRRKV
eukprot:gene17753-20226_t